MGFLDRAIKDGINKGVSNAIGNAVKQVIEPKVTAYADKVANEIDQAAKSAAQVSNEAARQQNDNSDILESAFANLQHSMESYTTEAAKHTKICPQCGEPTTADKKFCPSCGAKLPEETLAQGAVCTKCGTQNSLGTRFCQECGEKLPFAIAEEEAAAQKSADTLAKWNEILPEYPVWSCGGRNLELEKENGYCKFSAVLENESAARDAVSKYRELLLQNGFRKAGEYPCIEHLYKKAGTDCYHVDTEHCLDGDADTPEIYFDISEPAGGFDYVKPEPKKSFGLRDLFR